LPISNCQFAQPDRDSISNWQLEIGNWQ